MSRFPLRKIKTLSLTWPVASLLLLIQVSLWYSSIQAVSENLLSQQRKLDRIIMKKEKKAVLQNLLLSEHFIQETWAHHQVIAYNGAYPKQWQLEGSAKLVEWKTLLEYIENVMSVSLSEVFWERVKGGYWKGRLVFNMLAMEHAEAYRNWLPYREQPALENTSDWLLVSTMKDGSKATALLQHKHQHYWVAQGVWIPDLEMSVEQVLKDRIVLVSESGKRATLSLHSKENEGGQNVL